jgi:hypothetical protein
MLTDTSGILFLCYHFKRTSIFVFSFAYTRKSLVLQLCLLAYILLVSLSNDGSVILYHIILFLTERWNTLLQFCKCYERNSVKAFICLSVHWLRFFPPSAPWEVHYQGKCHVLGCYWRHIRHLSTLKTIFVIISAMCL